MELNELDGRSTVGVGATPTVSQILCTSAFQPSDGRRGGLFITKFKSG